MNYSVNTEIKLIADGEETNVLVVDVRPKAIKVKGNVSQAWFPKSAIDENGVIAKWVTLTMSHCFLWDTPYDKSKMAAH